jgi:hypothetical protein
VELLDGDMGCPILEISFAEVRRLRLTEGKKAADGYSALLADVKADL